MLYEKPLYQILFGKPTNSHTLHSNLYCDGLPAFWVSFRLFIVHTGNKLHFQTQARRNTKKKDIKGL